MRSKILIVDDNPANIQILSQVLEHHYGVFFATSGSQCLQLVQRQGR